MHAPKQTFAAENALYPFLTFAAVGGFLEVYTYMLHGGVFCNAQTGNLVLLFLNLTSASWADASHYLYSLLSYVAGILVSAALPLWLRQRHAAIAVTCLEAAALAGLAFIPAGAPNWYTYVSVSFLCALQYNTFTSCRDAKLATTFCTNNLRQLTLNLFGAAREKSRQKLRLAGTYAAVILFFAAGAVAGGFAAEVMGNYCILLCTAALLPAAAWLLFSSRPEQGAEQ